MLFPGKGFFLALLVAIGFMSAWQFGNGYLRLGRDPYNCYGGKRFYKQVDKQRLFAVGQVNWFYQPWTWGCPADYRYDPSKYQVQDGLLTPKNP